ncbi:FabD/lysophospholipase-like protein, partial [Hyaloscypha bicolor E]
MFFGGEGDFIFAYKLTKVNVKERFPSIARPIESEGQEDGKKPTTDADASEEEAPSETRPGLGVESTDGEDLVFDGEEDIAVSDPTKPARILCLDGGGVRGISSLCMLKEIMLEVGREKQPAGNPEPVRPCDYFDLICGTSTGGLIALMLGRLRYTVDEAIDQYTRLSEAIFTSRSNNP